MNLNLNQLGIKRTLSPQSYPPASAQDGDVYLNTTTNRMSVWQGGRSGWWKPLSTQSSDLEVTDVTFKPETQVLRMMFHSSDSNELKVLEEYFKRDPEAVTLLIRKLAQELLIRATKGI